jgi:hypothetical protein
MTETVPDVWLALADAPVPQRLKDLDYIYFYPEPKRPGFGGGLRQRLAARERLARRSSRLVLAGGIFAVALLGGAIWQSIEAGG